MNFPDAEEAYEPHLAPTMMQMVTSAYADYLRIARRKPLLPDPFI